MQESVEKPRTEGEPQMVHQSCPGISSASKKCIVTPALQHRLLTHT